MITADEEKIQAPCHYVTEKQSGNVAETKTGAKAVVAQTADTESLKLFSNEGNLIFEYDTLSGKSMIHVPSGDLEINAGDGDIILNSSKSINMIASDISNQQESVFRMTPGKISLNGTELDINAQKSVFTIEKTSFIGKALWGNVNNVKLEMIRFETTAKTVIEKLKNVYRTVEGLTQLHTGRMRTIVDTTLHVKSNKAYMKAEDDFKIKGEKIHLG